MNFSYPPYRYVPGKSPRHEEATFEAVLAAIEELEDMAAVEASPVWRHVIDLLEQSYFWEAHEVLEAVWMKAAPNSSEAIFLQGVIQIANCGLKKSMNQEKAAKRLERIAIEQLELAFRNRPNEEIMGFGKADALRLLDNQFK